MNGRIEYCAELAAAVAAASAAYRARDDEKFAHCMRDAIECAPWRLDLRFDIANHHIQTGATDRALAEFEVIAGMVPTDIEAWLSLAHWHRFAGDDERSQAAFDRLASARPAVAAELTGVWRTIDRWLALPLSGDLPDLPYAGEGAFLVVLGYRLAANGSMRDILVHRLTKALEIARKYPELRVVVSGGLPRENRVEAVAMRHWLAERGVKRERILEEGYSRDVVENIVYTRQILDAAGAVSVIAVNSANNVRRTGACLEVVAMVNGSGWTLAGVVAANHSGGYADEGQDRLKVFRDALRSYGILMMRTFPLLVER